jgi:hypothetical protein
MFKLLLPTVQNNQWLYKIRAEDKHQKEETLLFEIAKYNINLCNTIIRKVQ